MKKKFKNALSMLLCLIMVFGAVAVGGEGIELPSIKGLFGSEAQAETNEFAGGNGTENNPYLISTPEQLSNVRNHLNSYFKQIADLDMESISNWQPIGNAGSSTGSTLIHDLPEVTYEPFSGNYDGNNYRIKNITIYDSNISFATDIYGLFAALGKCTVKNIHLTGINYTIDKATTDYVNLWNEYGASYGVYVGGIAGKSTGDSVVTNCSSSGTIKVMNCNDASVGGILGYGEATKCENSTNIYINANSSSRYETDSTVWCGGIVGKTPYVNSVVSECLNQGNINATAGNFLYVGGISGEDGRVENCMNCGEIEGHTIKNSSHCTFAGNCNAGGITGATSSDYVKYCVNYGNVSASADAYTSSASSYAGGIVGYCGYYGSGKVFSCVNIGTKIYSSKKDNKNQTDEANAGRISGSSISISECYSFGSTTVNGSTKLGCNTDSDGESVNTSTLLTQMPYKGFDFNNLWSFDDDLGGAVLTGFYNPEISGVESPTGTSVSMVGKHFYANIGKSGLSLSPGGKATGNQATCYVPVSSQDLDFTFESGNKNILAIGDTEVTFHGVYFIKFNVFGISEGTTTVTVRTSDGASSTAIVTVSETPTSDKILKGEGKLPADAKILAGTMDDYVTAVVLNSNKTYVSDVIIDQKTYPIQKNILPDATIEMFKGKPVIAVMQDGKITEIDLTENYITASVSTNFIDGTAVKDGDTHLITAAVSNTLPSRLTGADLSSLSDKFKIKINSVSIKIGNESVYSGNPNTEIGVDGFKTVASKEVKIKKSFANVNGEADIKVVVTGERNGTPLSLETKSSIKILSKSEWNKISESANKKKTEKQYDNEIKATVAKNSKNLKLDETIAWNATLGEFMSKKQLSALGYAMVGTIVMAEAPKATFTEYLTGKMLDKLGVAHKIAAGAFSVDVPMTVKIKTYKYGELVIDFEAHATNYTLGGKSYGSFGDVTYEITGGSGLSKVPTSMRSGLAGAIAYADVNTFADAMYDIALAEVKKAYNLGYGNDFNTVCDVFFNDTIVDVMLSACKTDYKGAFFDIISYPARQYKGACPIEMRVYDPSNELCGFVSDSKAVSTDENVECTVEGHTKIITVYGYKANDFKVEITATGSGVMNLEASDYAGSCRKLGSQTFTDFPIECDKTYSYICGAVSLDESSKDMITDGSNKVYADDITIFERADIEATKDKYTIVFWSADGSKIIGLYELLPGESIPSIEAPKKVGYDFVGWANENGKIEEIPSTMPASERSFTAVFEPIKTKISINTPSTTTVSYGFTLNLHANVTDLPEGARVVWSMDGSGFELIPSADGMTCGVKSVSKGSATITAKVVDKNGNAVKDANGNEITASQQLTSKAGFFQKLVAFFKKLFGSNMVIPSSLNKLIK